MFVCGPRITFARNPDLRACSVHFCLLVWAEAVRDFLVESLRMTCARTYKSPIVSREERTQCSVCLVREPAESRETEHWTGDLFTGICSLLSSINGLYYQTGSLGVLEWRRAVIDMLYGLLFQPSDMSAGRT